ncbi:copper resistance protein CopC [Streptomyces longwoodensis]|uniref:copper resistance CopC/CopD family protein n=1 Tax=Streptomyces longwoodensis TaxID=68231 RepID=UPI002DDB72A2|nr:copper resistance protein CopC [Streptomyces longwoodensis]WRY93012.1 copper resistance protein CopC [Streptomyces longwoodensis]
MLLGTFLLLLLLPGANPASAHAALRATDPADGSVVPAAPRSVTLTFTESVGLLDDSFRVLDPTGHRVPTGDAEHAGGHADTARISLPAGLATGTFTVAWRVVSADSHPVSGAFTFSVGAPSATAAPVPAGPTEDPLTAFLYGTARYAAYLAAALLIGTAAFVAVCRPTRVRPLRGLLRAGGWGLAGATVLLLVLRAPYESGDAPGAALDLDALGRTLTGRPGWALLARLALLAASALLLTHAARRGRPSRTHLALGTVLAVGLALTWAAAEHASAGIQVPLAMTSSVVHLLAMAAWLGGLTALLVLLRRDTPPLATVTRFSRLAMLSVTALAVTGLYQAWRGLGTLTALTDTSYGRLLLAKLAAVTVLLMAADWSRRWVGERARSATPAERKEELRMPQPVGAPRTETPAPDGLVERPGEAGTALTGPPSDGDAHRRALRRSVLVEVLVATVVLALTTVLTGTLPGRAEAEAEATEQAAALPATSVVMAPFSVAGHRGTVQVTLDPARTGDNAVEAVVYGADGGLAAVPELRIAFTFPAQDIGPLNADLTDRGGYWATNAVNLPLAGTWTMKVTVRVSDVDQVTVGRPVRVAR